MSLLSCYKTRHKEEAIGKNVWLGFTSRAGLSSALKRNSTLTATCKVHIQNATYQ